MMEGMESSWIYNSEIEVHSVCVEVKQVWVNERLGKVLWGTVKVLQSAA